MVTVRTAAVCLGRWIDCKFYCFSQLPPCYLDGSYIEPISHMINVGSITLFSGIHSSRWKICTMGKTNIIYNGKKGMFKSCWCVDDVDLWRFGHYARFKIAVDLKSMKRKRYIWGVFQLETVKIVLTSHFHKKSESHHRSRSHFATPMMVLYRKWANDLGTKWPNWNTNFARNNWKTPWC